MLGLFFAPRVKVFAYHGIVEKKRDPRLERNFTLLSDFREHINFFRRQNVMSCNELLEHFQNKKPLKRQGIVITFDDGYANNLLVADIMASLRLPWALFVSTGSCGHENTIWTVELALFLLYGECAGIEIFKKNWFLRNRQEREMAFQKIRTEMKSLSFASQASAMNFLKAQFPEGEKERLLKAFPDFQMLSWPEIKQLADSGVEIGSHGVYHEIHHANQPLAARQHALKESKVELEKKLNRICRFFAFPNGDALKSSPRELRDSGYQLGFTMQPKCATLNSNPYLLPRLTLTQREFWRLEKPTRLAF